MSRPDLVVAVTAQDEHSDITDPPSEVLEKVERGVVGPVQVLDDDDPRAAFVAQPFEQAPEERIPRYS
jgi:hypothetical protein